MTGSCAGTLEGGVQVGKAPHALLILACQSPIQLCLTAFVTDFAKERGVFLQASKQN